jgi:hypothetical protein
MGLARQVADLCLLRGGPQELPWSPALTRNLVLLLAAVELLQAALLGLADPLPRVLVGLGVLLGAPWLVLVLRGRLNRFMQTLAALAATGLVFTVAFMPLALLVRDLPGGDPTSPPSGGQLLVGWAALLLLGWKLMINAHIYRHALDWPRVSATLLVLALFLIELGLYQALFRSV